MGINGFINVLKPPGMTSHDVVGCMRRVYKTKKVGHAGTLDPAAAGVLIIAIGYATRVLEYITDVNKSYRAEVLLGVKTDSGDDTGKILEQSEVIMPDEAKIHEMLKKFQGEIEQVPPVYSAIKINGQKAYDLARKNIAVEMPKRQVMIHDISLQNIYEKSFCIDVNCSKGTYIRSLCSDIGDALGIPATMAFLVRTGIGRFKLTEAFTLEEIANAPLAVLQGMDSLLGQMDDYEINDAAMADFRQGKRIAYTGIKDEGTVLLVHNKDDFAGIGKITADKNIAPHKVFADK